MFPSTFDHQRMSPLYYIIEFRRITIDGYSPNVFASDAETRLALSPLIQGPLRVLG
jgi:hypothetical protein